VAHLRQSGAELGEREGIKMRLIRRRSKATPAIGLLVLALLLALTIGGSAGAAATNVPLGTAGSFAVLAGSGITNTGATTVVGDVGTYPTTTITGAGSMTVFGTNHAGDAVTQQAKTDLVTAYNDAAGQGPTSPIVADLGGQTLAPGVYNSGSTIGLTGTVTLNGGGDPNAVFVFQAGSSLTTASTSQVSLINGAQACNVFWQLGASATLGTGSTFSGSILALTSITVNTGVTVHGRMLARNGDVTLDHDAITRSNCSTPVPQSSPSASREIYCAPNGTAYDLVVGQDKLPPYNTLGLVPAYVDPVTGAETCVFPVAVTTTATTTTTTTTTTTVAPPPPPKPPVVVKKAKAVAAAKKTVVLKPKARPAKHKFGFTG